MTVEESGSWEAGSARGLVNEMNVICRIASTRLVCSGRLHSEVLPGLGHSPQLVIQPEAQVTLGTKSCCLFGVLEAESPGCSERSSGYQGFAGHLGLQNVMDDVMSGVPDMRPRRLFNSTKENHKRQCLELALVKRSCRTLPRAELPVSVVEATPLDVHTFLSESFESGAVVKSINGNCFYCFRRRDSGTA